MQILMNTLDILRRLGQKLGPYLMLEILLPGGTLFAALFFLYQRRKLNIGRTTPSPSRCAGAASNMGLT